MTRTGHEVLSSTACRSLPGWFAAIFGGTGSNAHCQSWHFAKLVCSYGLSMTIRNRIVLSFFKSPLQINRALLSQATRSYPSFGLTSLTLYSLAFCHSLMENSADFQFEGSFVVMKAQGPLPATGDTSEAQESSTGP